MRRGVGLEALPEGVRQDTRKHTRHILRPEADDVIAFLDGRMEWPTFAVRYRKTLERRYASDSDPFDVLATLARKEDVYLGCSCPTRKNPDVRRCHTWLALEFMGERYPDLDVRFPV